MLNQLNQKQNLGQKGELLARNLLQNKGYHLLFQNYRTRIGEIDLIFMHQECVVFVEVKTRISLDQGLPEEAVTSQKLWKIERVGEQFLIEKNLEDKLARIDVVAVEFLTDPPVIRHHQDVSG